jgi:hypothetical protein
MSHAYFTQNLSASRFCRRLHAIPKELWQHLFRLLGELFVRSHSQQNYVVDSVPIPVCDNIRIHRCKLLTGEELEFPLRCGQLVKEGLLVVVWADVM